ncbi:calcium-dependent secretion activator [Mytilus galloprovincialis]|uniref:Calcium-dependent secretion activator n=1 Tax=Mytilus galloprovincialis TaxID=29158 RepID=A0A8B6CQL2_MYTGA|nr:calcium-dependent secretion activator [Mytilus galloprovincialis]
MESKLKAVRRGHRGQVTKLFKKFDEIEKNSDLDKDDVKLISDAVEQKQKTIVDLNEKILDLTSEEDVEEEIQESDEYMFNLESKLRKIRKIYSDSISQNVASTSLDPNANSFMPSYPTNSSLTNANVIRSNETEINVQPTNFDNFRSMQNTHRNHGVAECKSRNRCKKCNKKHHTSICGEQATDGKGQDSKEKSTVVSLVKTEEPETALPWKLDHPDLPSNIMIAKARTESTIRRLSREPHLLRKYSEIIEDQMKRGFIEKVNDENNNGKSTHYIPHHAVKKDSTTTPIRIVYDCSCKKSPDHANDNNDDSSTERLTRVLPKREASVRARENIKKWTTQNYLYAVGKNVWKKWKKRYFVLVQVSQYTFAMCSYREKKPDPTEMMQLWFTVDYCEPLLIDIYCDGGKYFYNTVKEGDNVVLATDDENERTLWVQAIYRATGQTHKPVPPVIQTNRISNTQISRMQGDADRAKKHGLDEYVQANPAEFDHHELFLVMQTLTLDYRLSDAYTCLGWFSPGQVFVLDEYCARYGVRGCHRHLCYLSDLLERAENGILIDPTLIHYSFAFCASHVHGNRPDGIGTVLLREKEKFDEIKERLHILLEKQITHFRYCFPFGRPEGALKATLSLLERVLMKDIVTPVPPEEVRNVIKKCLENAALVNYTRISEYAKIEESYNNGVSPKKRLDDVMHLAELCIEVLQQNEEHHAEAFAWFSDLLVEHAEIFWSLFAVDMDSALEMQPSDTWDSFPLFQALNDYLRNDENLCGGKFHLHLRNVFAPQVVRYVDLMESSIAQSIHKGFEKEKWEPQGNGCATSEDMLWKLDALQSFIRDLHWPEEVFAEHLDHRLKLMAADMIEAAAKRTLKAFEQWLRKGGKGTDYVIYSEICVMMNVIIDCKSRALHLCALDSGENMHQYHTKIEEFLERVQAQMVKCLIEKLLSVMESVLSKLARYDEGTFFSSILSLTKPVNELGKSYVDFMRCSLDQIRQKIADELFTLSIFEQWYTSQMKMTYDWLSDRLDLSLHPYQLTCIMTINRKCYSDFELQGVLENILNDKTYQNICKRLQVEEATHSVTQCEKRSTGFLGGGTSSNVSNDSDEESD